MQDIIDSSSSDSEDGVQVPVQPLKGRRKMPTIPKEIEVPECHVYTSQVLKYREMQSRLTEAPSFLKDKNESDINEEKENVFTSTKGHKEPSGKRKQVKEIKELADDVQIVSSTDMVTPPTPIEEKIPIITEISQQSTSILREFEEVASVFSNPNVSSMNTSTTSLDDCEIIERNRSARDINIKIRWMATVLRFPMKSDQPFSSILPDLAKEITYEATDIVLSLDEITIKPSETPESIHLRIVDILDCYIIKEIGKAAEDENFIELKLQSDCRWKKTVKLRMDSPMQNLIEKCASEKGIPSSKVIFKFDGEVIDPSETPTDLDLESGLCIDVTFLP